jgi:hypothetical protein
LNVGGSESNTSQQEVPDQDNLSELEMPGSLESAKTKEAEQDATPEPERSAPHQESEEDNELAQMQEEILNMKSSIEPGAEGEEIDVDMDFNLKEFMPDDDQIDFSAYAERLAKQKNVDKDKVAAAIQTSQLAQEPAEAEAGADATKVDVNITQEDLEGALNTQPKDAETPTDAPDPETSAATTDKEPEQKADKAPKSQADEERPQPQSGEEASEPQTSEKVSKPKPPRPHRTNSRPVRQYDDKNKALYVVKDACASVLTNTRNMQNLLKSTESDASKIALQPEHAKQAKDKMHELQSHFLELEEKLFH